MKSGSCSNCRGTLLLLPWRRLLSESGRCDRGAVPEATPSWEPQYSCTSQTCSGSDLPAASDQRIRGMSSICQSALTARLIPCLLSPWTCLEINTDSSGGVSETDNFTSNKNFLRRKGRSTGNNTFYIFASCPEYFLFTLQN